MINLGLYIHIPFCNRKCNYCDFLSFEDKYDLINEYIEALILDIERESTKYSDYLVDSIFIGGGTPSSIKSEYIASIMECIYNNYNVSNKSENTIEANPKTVNKEKLQDYINSNINRISIGAQSFIKKELMSLGRIHSPVDIVNSVNMAREAGFTNISCDLMMGIPYQSLDSLEKSLDKFLELDIPHISIYDLILEEGSKFYRDLEKGIDLKLPEEDINLEMFKLIKEKISPKYIQYEISNYGKQGYESVHNKKYWTDGDYLAFGLGGSSKISNIRYKNIGNLQDFIANSKSNISNIEYREVLSPIAHINEIIFMGLRLNKGISIEYIDKKFNIDFKKVYSSQIEKNLERKYIELINNHMRLTDLGRMYANIIELDFYTLEGD